MKKVWVILADLGLDDAAAVAHLLRERKRSAGIVLIPIGGNVPVEMAFANARTLLCAAGDAMSAGVTVVDTRAIPQRGEYLPDFHGKDGMGDILPAADVWPRDVRVVAFADWLEGFRESGVLLSLGPTTLARTILEKRPELSLVLMGGCIRETPNFHGYEFNHALDREAFAFCVQYPHVAITMDTCRVPRLNLLRDTIPGDGLYERLLRADQAVSEMRGDGECRVWDDVAALYLLEPNRFRVSEERDRDGNRVLQAVYCSERAQYEEEGIDDDEAL
jgi:inosine-uridine nucleoside N-ribohydrolase